MVQLAVTLLVGAFCVVTAIIIDKCVLHRYNVWWMTESGATIGIGMCVGLAWYLYWHDAENAQAQARLMEMLEFQPAIFTLLLLPPIIFEAGYNMNHSFFYSNLGGITTFAFLGTLIAFGVTAPVLYYGLGGVRGLLTPMEAAAFSALISAVDPVATLAIFSSSGADPSLNSLIFGESVLNDVVSIVLFKTIVQLGQTTRLGLDGWVGFTPAMLLSALGDFLLIFAGSIAIGVLGGFAIALIFKLIDLRRLPQSEAPPTELLVLVSLAYSTFLMAEFAHLSGIVAALFAGIVSAVYVKRNLTERGRSLCSTVIRALAHFCETVVFLLIGYGFWLYTIGGGRVEEPLPRHSNSSEPHPHHFCVDDGDAERQLHPALIVLTLSVCLISRFCSVFLVAPLINGFRSRDHKIGINEMAVIWLAGLRGAIALALAVDFPTYHETNELARGSFCFQRDHILACTIVVILFTVFVMGGLTKPMLSIAGIPVGVVKIKSAIAMQHRRCKGSLLRLDNHVLQPIFLVDPSAR